MPAHRPTAHVPTPHEPAAHRPGAASTTTTTDGQEPTFNQSGYSPTRTDLSAIASNYEICDASGFKARVDELVEQQWDGRLVLPKFYNSRHPMDLFRPQTKEKSRGPKSPEPDDGFLATNAVSASDL